MGRTDSVTGSVEASPDETFAFVTDLEHLPEWNAIMVGVVERPNALVRRAVAPAVGGGSRVTVSWDLRPQTFWRGALLSRVRSRQLRGEVPASIDALDRALRASTG